VPPFDGDVDEDDLAASRLLLRRFMYISSLSLKGSGFFPVTGSRNGLGPGFLAIASNISDWGLSVS